MSDTWFSAEKFLDRNPLPATPNPLVNETLAQLRVWFWLLWQGKSFGAMLHCAAALVGCTRPKRGAIFTREWESWQKDLADEIGLFFETLFYMGRANVDCALPDPATWACNSLYLLIRENLVCPTGDEHLVDDWLKHACCQRPIRIWESPIGVGFYGVSASDEKIRDSDQIISVLRQIFEQEVLDHLFGCRVGALLRLAKDGWHPAAEGEPMVTLQDLKRLAPRDGRRHGFVYAIYPKLRQEISDARAAVRKEQLSLETIRQRFPLLGEAEDALLKKLILDNPDATTDATAAVEIISAFAGSISDQTVERYTRHLPDASSNSKEIPGCRPLRLRLLHHQHVRDCEELLVSRNRVA
jgi:hypothetical protein